MPRTTKRQALKARQATGPVHVHFYPRQYQLPVWDAMTTGGYKRGLTIWHRGAGKDYTWLWIIWYAMTQKPGQYFHIFPTYSQGKRAIWEASAEIQGKVVNYLDIFPKALIEDMSETELQIRLAPIPPHTVGCIYQIIGAENADAIRGTHPSGAVLSEYRDMKRSVWEEVVEPALLPHDGWAGFATTTRGKNHLWELYEAVKTDPHWFVQLLPCTHTFQDAQGESGERVYPDEAVAKYRVGKDEATVQQELFCSFEGNLEGAVFGREMAAAQEEGRIHDFPLNSSAPCGTWWDLGFADASAVWVYQMDGKWIDVIDYLEVTRQTSAEIATLLKSRPYAFARHTMPWDVDQQHDGQSRREVFERLGIRPIVVAPKDDVREGIDRVRRFFPRMRFHQTKCARGLEALRNYRYEWDEAKGQYKDKPLHDKWSHGADALRTGVMGWIEGLGGPAPTWTHADMTFDLYRQTGDPRQRSREPEMAFSLFGR